MLPHLLKTIVVDDEAPSREAIINYTRENCPDVQIVAECDSIETAFNAIAEHSPHLVFLDIEMPWGNGFELLKKYDVIPFNVIFITAFSDYAVQAFRLAATDFLLKPLKVKELVEAVAKVRKEMVLNDLALNYDVLMHNLETPEKSSKKIRIPNAHGFTVINTEDIIMCKADTYCTNFILSGEQEIKSSHNLRYYEDMLPDCQFIRVHNSYIVNIDHIKSYNNHGYIYLSDSKRCPLSTARKPDFLRKFKEGCK